MLNRLVLALGLLKDIWRSEVLPQLDQTSACMLAHAVGVGRAATPRMLAFAYRMKWANVVKYLRNASVGMPHEHACAMYYGMCTEAKPHGWISDAVHVLHTGNIDTRRISEYTNYKLLGIGGHGTHTSSGSQAGYAAMGFVDKVKENNDWSLRCAIMFSRENVVKRLLAEADYFISDEVYIYAHNRVNLIKLLRATGVKPHKYAYINAFGTPAFDELCACEPLDPWRLTTLYDLQAGLDVPASEWAAVASLVLNRRDIVRKCIDENVFTLDKYELSYLYVSASLLHLVEPTGTMVCHAIARGCVHVLSRLNALSKRLLSADQFMNAIAIEHMHPHVLEWMFAEGEFADSV